MGLDLTVAPIEYAITMRDGGERMHAYSRVALDRDYSIFGQIAHNGREAVKQVCDPKRINPKTRLDWYGDGGLEQRKDDPYGDPLTYVFASEFRRMNLGAETSTWNKAVFAMLLALPPETKVILYWH